jgi:hypothetical protein
MKRRSIVMTPNLSQFLGKSILVSIPALFEDGACRPYMLLAIEFNGLWLQSEELAARLLHEDNHPYSPDAEPAVFVAYAQIAGILVATAAPAQPGFRKAGVVAGSKRSGETKRPAQEGLPDKKKK